MRLVCPGCGVYGTIETFANDVDARSVAALLGELQPDVALSVQRYLRLFAPAKHALTWRKGRKVLDELVPLIKAGTIRRNGRDWPAPGAAWISAIDAMLGNANLELPMKSHGYLLSILAGDANKTEAQAERATEDARRSGRATPAALPDVQRSAVQAAHVRTATAMLIAFDTSERMKFGTAIDEPTARRHLKQFDTQVIDRAIAAWQRSAKQ